MSRLPYRLRRVSNKKEREEVGEEGTTNEIRTGNCRQGRCVKTVGLMKADAREARKRR